MDINEFAKLILKKKRLLAYFVLVFFTTSAVFTAVQPFEYEARMRLMTVQTFERELEPYSVAKSNQYLSSILVNVITSDSFYDKVIDSKFDIDEDYFYSLNAGVVEKWRDVVRLGAVDDTGIINLQVFHTDKYQASEISLALVDTVLNNYKEYYNVEHSVEIEVLDKVQVSNLPVRPNVLLNLGFGFLFGLFSGLCYIYLFAEKYQREVVKVKKVQAKRVLEQKPLKINKKENKFVAETDAQITTESEGEVATEIFVEDEVALEPVGEDAVEDEVAIDAVSDVVTESEVTAETASGVVMENEDAEGVTAKTAAEIAAIEREISQIKPESRITAKLNKIKKLQSQIEKQNLKIRKAQDIQYSKDDYNKIIKKGNINNLFG